MNKKIFINYLHLTYNLIFLILTNFISHLIFSIWENASQKKAALEPTAATPGEKEKDTEGHRDTHRVITQLKNQMYISYFHC